MVNTVLEQLKHGNTEIVEVFQRLSEAWKQFFAEHGDKSTEELAKELGHFQFSIEGICGDRFWGKEFMAWSAFSELYSTRDGFGDNESLAEKLFHAFMLSHCSGEVKAEAKDAAKAYYLDVQF